MTAEFSIGGAGSPAIDPIILTPGGVIGPKTPLNPSGTLSPMVASTPESQGMNGTLDVLVMVAILSGLIFGGFFLIWWIRKRLSAAPGEFGLPFSLSDLREMLARGEITQQEFDQARQAMIESLGASPLERKIDTAPKPSGSGDDVP